MRPDTTRLPTPEEFLTNIVPVVVAHWQQRCLCRNPQFCKLLSFNFEDYQTGPAALLDAEILIDNLIRRHYESVGEPVSTNRGIIQISRCPQCGVSFREQYEEYSISMYRAFVSPVGQQPIAAVGRYVLGFRGFRDFSPERVYDFQPADSIESFLSELTAAV